MANMASYGAYNPNAQAPLPAPIAPYKMGNNAWLSKMGANWKLDPNTGGYLKKYNNEYDKIKQLIQSGLLNKIGIGGAGLGKYDSSLLGSMSDIFLKDLLNPESSQEYGLTMDRLAAQEGGAKTGLENRFAGWSRGNGVYEAAQAALGRDLMRQKANTGRETAIAAKQNAVANSMGLEGLLSSIFENSKQRELSNADINAGWNFKSGTQMNSDLTGLLGNLADMLKWGSASDVNAQQGSFQNLGAMNEANLADQARLAGENQASQQYGNEVQNWLWKLKNKNGPAPTYNKGYGFSGGFGMGKPKGGGYVV